MTKTMLIDTSHPEETRVVVVSGNRLEDFDYESTSRKQLKSNIYLAKVTRVEPSLQAAFVEYGGNRHGFLPFSEIHPDYYRIPIADREALLAAEAESAIEIELAEPGDTGGDGAAEDFRPDAPPEVQPDLADLESSGAGHAQGENPETIDGAGAESADAADPAQGGAGAVEELPVESNVDTLGGDDLEDAARRRAKLMRRYKIQEVIKRRQVILVQVTKEERGNKGAALTTYLSLAGRYCVLMPNTAKGGGISRKIASAVDRRRLKGILEELQIPEGIAVIVRTAGSERTKAEIRRDYDFLLRLWDEIRSTTLASTAPALIYEEASLIKRAVRDMYQSDTDEILVEGDEGYKAAKAFMKSLTPSHARKVKQYKDPAIPLFYRYQVENQIDAMHNPVVQLRSGGYIVIHMTEALVAIDVNSGKATRERHIEETAYKTNLEAAEEVGRQLRLRDMAGLIVIDFIDMDESRHNRTVERKLKDAMRQDRARIQLGRISPFGLLELSRQRLRPSLLESSTEPCPYCTASGYVRTTQSVALHVLRGLEEEGIRRGGGQITIAAPRAAALHLLNQMRDRLVGIEQRYGLRIWVTSDDTLIPPNFTLQRSSVAPAEAAEPERPHAERPRAERPHAERELEDEDGAEQKRGRGRRRRKRAAPGAASVETEAAAETAAAGDGDLEDEHMPAAAPGGGQSDDEAADDKPRRRRRGRRGGRGRARRPDEENGDARREDANAAANGTAAPGEPSEDRSGDRVDEPSARAGEDESAPGAEPDQAKPSRGRRRRGPRRAPDRADVISEPQASELGAPELAAPDSGGISAGESDPARGAERVTGARTPAPEPVPETVATLEAGPAGAAPQSVGAEIDAPDEAQQKRRGWWNRWT